MKVSFHRSLKKGKDPLGPGGFILIILVNVDSNVLTKVLSMRLEKILLTIIHSDQVGFI